MINDQQRHELRSDIERRVQHDSKLLDQLRADVRSLKSKIFKIQPRQAHSVSIVATDGGNNKFQFDPFLLQVVRVVDSNNNSYAMDVVSPSTQPADVLKKHFDSAGKPVTALGRMMKKLGTKTLHELSSMIPEKVADENSTAWVPVFRELQEWAVLLDLASERSWGSDTVLIFDGLLRTKKFAGALFRDYRALLEQALIAHRKKSGRRVYVIGIGKDNQVLTRYRLAMTLEGILTCAYPAYVEVPRKMELATFKWKEWARGDDISIEGGEVNKFVGGKLFFVKFGEKSRDSIWATDIIQPQISEQQLIFGCVLNDAEEGFPVLNYPRSLQTAHENAAMVGFDMELLGYEMFEVIRRSLGSAGTAMDEFKLQVTDAGSQRYG
jgi:hypothetical protein